jgi:putative pyruvate formate lyase activating enzyme
MDRLDSLDALLSPCRLCPRECGADRLGGKTGLCGIGPVPKVASLSVHPGEEPPLSGTRGSGTVFFTGCNLRCLFCQNYPISQMGVGREMTVEELAEGMLRLEAKGAHNINLVTPTHVAPQAARAVAAARAGGLSVPVVWNSNGYERPEVIELLEGTIDVWLPDMKYDSDESARRCSGVGDYVGWNRRAVAAMYRQAGHLVTGPDGTALRGLVVRHLVLPGGLAGTKGVLADLARIAGTDAHLSLMSQYFPAHRAGTDPLLARRLTGQEWEEALDLLTSAGFPNGWVQEHPDEDR